MSVVAPAHPVRWTAPAPLWSVAGPTPSPVLLTLPGDRFMDDLRDLIADDPARLASRRAVARSHRLRPPGRGGAWEPAGAPDPPLKLFGAVHGHFNLVAASLVCQVGGLPERRVRVAEGDRLVFVLRRLTASGREEGWVPGVPDGRWIAADADELLEGEERLPMFSLDYEDADEHPRRLHVGLVPTTSLESWTPPRTQHSTPAATAAQALARRKIEVNQLAAALAALRDPAVTAGTPSAGHLRSAHDATDLWLIDLAEHLARWHPSLWAALGTQPVAQVRSVLRAGLEDATLADGTHLATRLKRAWEQREALLGEAGGAPQTLGASLVGLHLNGGAVDARTLSGWLLTAVPDGGDPPPPSSAGPGADAHAPRRPKIDPSGAQQHVIRCAYVRPHCDGIHGPIVSAPTEPFRLASFFDPDAPSRDVHIALPLATGVKDLRKLRKSVTVALSDQLQSQMSRIGDLKDVLAGKRRDGEELDFGLVCSFSIPIITLCALIVLMIFVVLLNVVFFWMPLLRFCLPVPKGSGS